MPPNLSLDEASWTNDKFISRPELLTAIAQFAPTRRTIGGGPVRIGAIKQRASRTTGTSYLSFGCSACDALFGDFHLGDDILDARVNGGWAAQGEVTVTLAPPITEDTPHWGYPEDGPWCALPSPNEGQGGPSGA